MIKAIDTLYDGHRFRSRLEARWAVLFNHLGIRWEYEPQGFELPPRLSQGNTIRRYLPDFWLPDRQEWAEVKGSLDDDGLLRLLDTSAALSEHCAGVVILGPIVNPPPTPIRLIMHKGDLIATTWKVADPTSWFEETVAHDCGGNLTDITGNYRFDIPLAQLLLQGASPSTNPARYMLACEAARTARFEHGQRP